MHFRVARLFGLLLFFAASDSLWPFAFQGTPVVQLTPTSVDFGPGLIEVPLSINPDCCSIGTVEIANTGNALLVFNSVSATAPFIVGDDPTSPPVPLTNLGPGEKDQIVMTFLPTTAGPSTGTLVIQDNAAGSPHQVPLTGVGVAKGDFGVGTNTGSSSVTVTAGQTANYPLRVAIATGAPSPITMTCSGLPAGASCGALSVGGTGPMLLTGFSLSVSTTAPMTASLRLFYFGWSFAAAAIVLSVRKKHSPRFTAMMFLAMLLTLTLVSCGGGNKSPTPPGTYNFTLTSTSGSVSHNTQFMLVVK